MNVVLTEVFLYTPFFKEKKYIITMSLKWSEFSLSMKSFLICTSLYCMGGLRLRSCLILLIQTFTMCSAWLIFILCLFYTSKIAVMSSYCKYVSRRRKSFMENHIIVFLHCIIKILLSVFIYFCLY